MVRAVAVGAGVEALTAAVFALVVETAAGAGAAAVGSVGELKVVCTFDTTTAVFDSA